MKSDAPINPKNAIRAEIELSNGTTLEVYVSAAGLKDWHALPEDTWVTWPLQQSEPQLYVEIRKRDVRMIVRE